MSDSKREGERVRRILRWAVLSVMGATLAGLFFASRTYLLYNSYPDNSITWREAMLPALADWYQWALLAPAIVWLGYRFPFERGRWIRPLAVHGAAGSALALVKIGIDSRFVRPLLDLTPIELSRAVWFSFHPNLLTYAVLVGLVHAVLYYRRYRERELRATQLEVRLSEARLQALRAQLHPHFLFNTLHAIGTLMHRDVEAAERMLTRLGDLLRVTIEHAGAQEVTLRQELEFLERYLEIEQTRFADRLEVRMEIDPATLDLAVPYLILQPLLENAIRHGIAPRTGPGRVEVRATRWAGLLELVIRDNGRGLVRRPEESRGVGLANTRARLTHLYGERHHFELHGVDEGGVEVKISIPAHELASEDAARAESLASTSRTEADTVRT